MSGSSWEYVMGVMVDEEGKPMSGRNSLYNSGFNGTFGCFDCDGDTLGLTELTDGYDWPDKKYYDMYAYATIDEKYQRRTLGDATGEMGPFNSTNYFSQVRKINSWNSNSALFIWSGYSLSIRSGSSNCGSETGVFAFSAENGRSRNGVGYRIILTPTKGTI